MPTPNDSQTDDAVKAILPQPAPKVDGDVLTEAELAKYVGNEIITDDGFKEYRGILMRDGNRFYIPFKTKNDPPYEGKLYILERDDVCVGGTWRIYLSNGE